MRLCPAGQRAEIEDEIGHPDHDEPQIGIPFRLGIFLGLGGAHEIAGHRPGAEEVVAKKHDPGADAVDQPCARGALQDVERGCDQRIAAETEDDAGRMHRTQTAETGGGPERCRLGPVKECGHPDADTHADHRPDQRHGDTEPCRRVVVAPHPVGAGVAHRTARRRRGKPARHRGPAPWHREAPSLRAARRLP